MYQPLQNSNAFEGFSGESSDLSYILEAELCMDPDIEVDELRHKLVTLNVQLKRIDRKLDYSRIIRTLGDVPHSQALLDRMLRQVGRMQRDLDQLQTPAGALVRLQAPPTFKAPCNSSVLAREVLGWSKSPRLACRLLIFKPVPISRDHHQCASSKFDSHLADIRL